MNRCSVDAPLGLVSDATHNGRKVIAAEAQALFSVAGALNNNFAEAVQLILDCSGNIIVGGVGKPWFIAQKISASMASTGTPSFALHPSDAAHGDIGRVREEDVVILLSNSGSSDEITRIIPILKQIGSKIVALTSNSESTLAQSADLVLSYGKVVEACPLGLAPSTSSTVMLAIGDALTLSVLEARNFGPADYAKYHPAGALGRQLMKVRQLMRVDCPIATPSETVWDAIHKITAKRAGAVFVVENQTLVGIFTDGDLRRIMGSRNANVLDQPISLYMTKSPITISASDLVGDAVRMMKKNKIDELPVISHGGQFLGYLDIQDILDVNFSVDSNTTNG